MIILKHLTIERFKALQEINLHFPQRGSILIQGPNEAGKSALFESIYFALYGTPIDTDHGRRTVDDLVHYGAASAAVTLTLSIGATELTINRTIERGKGQEVRLNVRRLGMPEEEVITHLAEPQLEPADGERSRESGVAGSHSNAANERIIAELGRMDGDTLRNSCFIEQQGLQRLEHLPGSEREATIRNLLGLEKLMRLTEQFKLTPNDEQMLVDCSEHLKLAEIQARIPVLSQQLGQIEAALDAVAVSEDLAEIGQQETDIAEQELSLEQLRAKRSDLKARQGRIQQLRKADATLAEVIAAYDTIAEARRELPELEQQIAELDRREREELPALEKRVNELVDLTRSFGTLERMSNDLLTSVSTIRAMEQELKQYQELQSDSDELDHQIIHAQLRVEQAFQAYNELEERRRSARPQLEARLQRLQGISERLAALHRTEEAYTQRVMQQGLIEENTALLAKAHKDVQVKQQELALLEARAREDQQQAEAAEKDWRELTIHRQLEAWLHVKGLSQNLAEAEQHVMTAHQQQEQLTIAALDARRAANKWLIAAIGCSILGVALAAVALYIASVGTQLIVPAVIAVLALLLFAGAAYSTYTYNKVHNQEQVASQRMQDAISQVGMMVAAREAAMRSGGGSTGEGGPREDLVSVEQEIRALGGTVPRSREEALYLLRQFPSMTGVAHAGDDQGVPSPPETVPLAAAQGTGDQQQGESLADLQQRITGKRDAAQASRSQYNLALEAAAALRREQQRLEDLRKNEGWDNIDATLRSDRIAIEDRQHEIATLAGQEGLPIPSFDTSIDTSIAQNLTTQNGAATLASAEFEIQLADAIKATEQELATLDGKLELVSELAATPSGLVKQLKIHQDALNNLQARKRVIAERLESIGARFITPNIAPATPDPIGQIERSRQQQLALRSALQQLQDSLRQRVKLLQVSFGQAAISNAEAVARKQLEGLHFALGSRVELQIRRTNYLTTLKDRQDLLADRYQQLAKFSASLGSWIIPPNPFAEALAALRQRCRQEIEQANESNILQELEKVRIQESASNAKIALCRQEIEETHERIAALLVQHNRPAPKDFNFTELVAVWPLIGEYTSQDRDRLEEQCTDTEKTLQVQEKQELTLSTQLHTGGNKLDLEQTRQRMEQQQRSYQSRKLGNQLIVSACERMLNKMLPRTEYYMQQILPLLTAGRYHDVRLTTEHHVGASLAGTQTASTGPLQLRVWDTAAAAYVYKSALSTGAADQLSLALRLAFAIAAFPRELAAAPGFVLLDEPLDAFDHARTQALVDVVTGDILGQHFEQVLFVSHSSAFDPAQFPFHLYMENGLIVESNLPVVPAIQATAGGTNGTYRRPDEPPSEQETPAEQASAAERGQATPTPTK